MQLIITNQFFNITLHISSFLYGVISFFLSFFYVFSLCLKVTKTITMNYKAEELNFRPIYARLFLMVSSFGQLQIYVKSNFCPAHTLIGIDRNCSSETRSILNLTLICYNQRNAQLTTCFYN